MGGDMEETVEQVLDSAADVVAGRIPGSKLGRLAIVSAVAFGAGACLSWVITKKRCEVQYEELIESEREEIKAFYAQLYKKDDFSTPGEAVEALSGLGETAVEALTSYGARRLQDVAVTVTETTEIDVVPENAPIRRNVFRDREVDGDDVWDQDKEEAYRVTIDANVPYIISQMEYIANEDEHEQQNLTYFVEDDVLVDEKDQPIPNVDEVVGEDSLTRFGHGHMDNRIVLVRNDRMGMDFEIVKNDGSYTKQVLGFQHSDIPNGRNRVVKFRGGDE